MTKRTRYSAEFKARVALDAIREELTLAELSKKHGVHPNMISGWKRSDQEHGVCLWQRCRISGEG